MASWGATREYSTLVPFLGTGVFLFSGQAANWVVPREGEARPKREASPFLYLSLMGGFSWQEYSILMPVRRLCRCR